MKKLLAMLVLAALVCLFTVSCGGQKTSADTTAASNASDAGTVGILDTEPSDATSDTTSDTPDDSSHISDWRNSGEVNGTLQLADKNADSFTGLLSVSDDSACVYADSDVKTRLFTLRYPDGLTVKDAAARFDGCGTDDADMNGLTDIYILFRDGEENGGRLIFLGRVENNELVYEYSAIYSTLLPPGDPEHFNDLVGEPLSDSAFLDGFWYPDGDLDADSYYYFSSEGEWYLYRLTPGTMDAVQSDSGRVYSDKNDSSRFYFGDSSVFEFYVGFRYENVSKMIIIDGEQTAYSSVDAG